MLPTRKKIKAGLIELLRDEGPLASSAVYKALEKSLSVSPRALELETNDGEQKFKKEVRWSKKDLVDQGVIKKPHESGRGTWELRCP